MVLPRNRFRCILLLQSRRIKVPISMPRYVKRRPTWNVFLELLYCLNFSWPKIQCHNWSLRLASQCSMFATTGGSGEKNPITLVFLALINFWLFLQGNTPTWNESPFFDCQGRMGFFGDSAREYRVFYYCEKDGRKHRFVCPSNLRFNVLKTVTDLSFIAANSGFLYRMHVQHVIGPRIFSKVHMPG